MTARGATKNRRKKIDILAFAKRIREGKGNPDKAAEAIWDSAQTMQKIVESTLDFARPIQLDIKEEDLAGIIKKVVHACKPKCEEGGVTLSARVPAAPMKIALDGHHIERALMNLVANSMDASSAGQEVVISNSALRGHAVEWITLIPMGR